VRVFGECTAWSKLDDTALTLDYGVDFVVRLPHSHTVCLSICLSVCPWFVDL